MACMLIDLILLNEIFSIAANLPMVLHSLSETSAKREFSAIVVNLKIDFFRYYSGLSPNGQ